MIYNNTIHLVIIFNTNNFITDASKVCGLPLIEFLAYGQPKHFKFTQFNYFVHVGHVPTL